MNKLVGSRHTTDNCEDDPNADQTQPVLCHGVRVMLGSHGILGHGRRLMADGNSIRRRLIRRLNLRPKSKVGDVQVYCP